MTAARIMLIATVLAATAGTVQARSRDRGNGGVPALNVKQSCSDAQKFSTGDDKNNAYKGCMQDETTAKTQLGQRWSSFKLKDRENCVAQTRDPSPSYVEVLTCLEMESGSMTGARTVDGKPMPQIGGPVAPGLSSGAMPR